MTEQCRYHAAAYPELEARDTCDDHRDDTRLYDLARTFAVACSHPEPSDEVIAWFIEDAEAVIDDFPPEMTAWVVTTPTPPSEEESFQLDFTLTINGEAYVIQQSEWESARPVKRSTWESWLEEAER